MAINQELSEYLTKRAYAEVGKEADGPRYSYNESSTDFSNKRNPAEGANNLMAGIKDPQLPTTNKDAMEGYAAGVDEDAAENSVRSMAWLGNNGQSMAGAGQMNPMAVADGATSKKQGRDWTGVIGGAISGGLGAWQSASSGTRMAGTDSRMTELSKIGFSRPGYLTKAWMA
jgi:hypothetical protein